MGITSAGMQSRDAE
ncbi:hypothetical protein AB6T15_002039, partial [Escherichia coli]